MDSRQNSYWLRSLSKIPLFLILSWYLSACSVTTSKTVQPSDSVVEVRKLAANQNEGTSPEKVPAESSSINEGTSPEKVPAESSSITDIIEAHFEEAQAKDVSASTDSIKPSTDNLLVLPREAVRTINSNHRDNHLDNHRDNRPDPDPETETETGSSPSLKETVTQLVPQKDYTGKPISLDFQDADVRSVLRLISEISNHNLVIDPDVSGKVTITLYKPVPWDQALEIILKTNHLAMKMEGNIIRVGQQKSFAQEEEANLKSIQAKQMSNMAEKKAIPLKTEIIAINYSEAINLQAQLSPMLSEADGLQEKPSIIVDERTNSLIIKDVPESIAKIREVLDKLDRETPQVMIETRIVETSKTFAKELGVRWGGQFQKETSYRFPRTVNVQGSRGTNYAVNLLNEKGAFGNIGLNLGHLNNITQLRLDLEAMESQGKGRIISNPRIATLDNQTAEIKSGAQIPYPAMDKDGNPTTNFVDAVIRLGVTPHITPNGYITLEISADKSEPNWSKQVNGVPSIKTRTANTKLIVKNGDTTVIGGLYQRTQDKNERKVPWFADLPGLRWLFKAEVNEESYDELLIFITPKIMEKS